MRCVCGQLSPNNNPDFVFNEGPAGQPGQKGQKGDVGPRGQAVYLPSSSDLLTKGELRDFLISCIVVDRVFVMLNLKCVNISQ